MQSSTEQERADYVAEAMRAYPTLAPLDATLALALAEARKACTGLRPVAERTLGFRANREKQ